MRSRRMAVVLVMSWNGLMVWSGRWPRFFRSFWRMAGGRTAGW